MPKPTVQRILRWAAYGIAAAGLVWVFHDVEWAKLLKAVAGLDWRWVALGVLLDVVSYAGQGARWRLLLRPLGDISLMQATQAVYAGLFFNEVVPFHLGEIARAYPVSRWMAAPLVAVIPSMALERLFDGIWLAAGIGITAIFVPLPRDLLQAGDVFGLAMLGLTAVLVYLLVRKAREPRPARTGKFRQWGPVRWVLVNLGQLEIGLRSIGFSRLSVAAFTVSFPILLLQMLSFWLIMVAYGLRLSFWVGGAVFLIVRFGTVIPGAPGNLGLYQLFCVLGLTLFGVDKTASAGFSIVVYVLLSIPLWVLGGLALGRTGMSMATIKARIKEGGDLT
ncbi:MAG TPA: lysylphosphatidylglycerol synthase transmembrane domain-containing protein [Acidobacteriota bacterium]|nr:lysylphosphatidylglycerol synthase transmembrane domain-containing protein [Acidobacteriota bacterium]